MGHIVATMISKEEQLKNLQNSCTTMGHNSLTTLSLTLPQEVVLKMGWLAMIFLEVPREEEREEEEKGELPREEEYEERGEPQLPSMRNGEKGRS